MVVVVRRRTRCSFGVALGVGVAVRYESRDVEAVATSMAMGVAVALGSKVRAPMGAGDDVSGVDATASLVARGVPREVNVSVTIETATNVATVSLRNLALCIAFTIAVRLPWR